MDYKGYKILQMNENDLALYYEKKILSAPQLNENEYLILTDNTGEAIEYFCKKEGRLQKLNYPIIKNSFENSIKPRNIQQYCAIDMLFNPEAKLKILQGVFGSGKDLLMFNAAIELVEKNKFEKIIFVRPHVTVGGLPDIGFLPGDVHEKLAWTLAPLFDKAGGEEGINYLISQNILEMVPMSFIRGRSFTNSIIYMTEGQNMTTEIIKLLIGRVGEGSELWINADTHQSDKRIYNEDNGVSRAIEKLVDNPLFGYIYLPITERSEVARLADLLD